jgi:hypothetical protein
MLISSARKIPLDRPVSWPDRGPDNALYETHAAANGPGTGVREKRGEVEPEDLSANLIVQLRTVTKHLNRHWYERNTGQVVTDVQRQVFQPVKRWTAATLERLNPQRPFR